MNLRDRAAIVGTSLRAALNHALVSQGDREMRQAIAALHSAARVEIEQSIAGRDRALDMLAEDR